MPVPSSTRVMAEDTSAKAPRSTRWHSMELLPSHRALGAATARAGRRTLLVFAAHFSVKLALRQADLIGELDTRRWGIAIWVAVAAVCAATTIPRRRPVSA